MPGDIPRLLPEGSPRLLEVPLFEGTDIFITEAARWVYARRLFGSNRLLRSWRYDYRSHLLLNKWWGWWSKLIHTGCEAGSPVVGVPSKWCLRMLCMGRYKLCCRVDLSMLT